MLWLLFIERILRCVREAGRLVICYIAYTKVLEHIKESAAVVAECNCAMMRIMLLDEDMTVEAAHFLDGENADAAKAAGCHRKNFAFSDVGTKLTFAVALETIEGNVRCCDVAFERAAGEIRLAACRLEEAVD